jgi:AcrR family transcriptional regulator
MYEVERERRMAAADQPDQPPKPRIRKAERRRQILEHAKELFVRLGYRDTTTENIALAAGISEPVLSRHFDNKKTLFLAVLREVRSATVDRWRTDLAAVDDPLAKLHAVAEMYLGSTRQHAREFRVVHRTLVEVDDDDVAAEVRSFYLDTETLLAELIAEGQQAGVFRRSLDPRVGAWELIRTGLGYTLTLPLGVPLYQEAGYLPQAIDCLLHCLLKTDV